MPTTVLAWELTVDRGPDSLWVKVNNPEVPSEPPPLADQLCSLLERHFTYRLVLDLSDVQTLDRKLLSELLRLQRRIRHHNGLMRFCGLSPSCQRLLKSHGLNDRFPSYCSLEDAVMGSWPRNPR
jgi:anti-anti-sigma regulatory factor